MVVATMRPVTVSPAARACWNSLLRFVPATLSLCILMASMISASRPFSFRILSVSMQWTLRSAPQSSTSRSCSNPARPHASSSRPSLRARARMTASEARQWLIILSFLMCCPSSASASSLDMDMAPPPLDHGLLSRRLPHEVHHGLAVPLTGSHPFRGDRLESLQVLCRQGHLEGRDVLLQPFPALRPGDGYDVLAPGKHPGQGQLRRRAPLFGGHLPDAVRQLEVAQEVFLLEAGIGAPEIVPGQVPGGCDRPCQKTPPQGAVGHKPDPELPAHRQGPVLVVPRPQGVLALEGRDGVHGVGPADGLRARLRETDVADLSFLHQGSHGTHGFLDRHLRVHAVLVVEIDEVDAKPLQTGL